MAIGGDGKSNPFGSGGGGAKPRDMTQRSSSPSVGAAPRPMVGPGAPKFGSTSPDPVDPQSIPAGGLTPFENEHVTPGQNASNPIGGGSIKVPEKPYSVS